MYIARYRINWPDGRWCFAESLSECLERINNEEATITDTYDNVVYTPKDFDEIKSYLLAG